MNPLAAIQKPTQLLLAYIITNVLCQVIAGILGIGFDPAGYFYLLRYLLLSGSLVLLVAFLLGYVSSPLSILIAHACFIVLLLTQLGLITYFLSAKVLLGADLFGYSINEIKETVSASSGLSAGTVLLWVLPLTAYFASIRLLRGMPVPAPIHIGLAALTLFAVFMPSGPDPASFKDDFERSKLENASTYFIKKNLFDSPSIAEESGSIPEFPFVHDFVPQDPLGIYFRKADTLPNIVFVVVEGLAGDFVGPSSALRGFTPFLDSLISQSLYWETCVSSTGRTFGALPTISGALPMGEMGFMNLGARMPNHQTLISVLKSTGYQSSFFYGGNSNFDGMDIFLEAQGTDLILGERTFPEHFNRTAENEEGFSWGYTDKALFEYSLELIKAQPSQPRLDFYLTLTTHEPFDVPEASYRERAQQILKGNAINERERAQYLEYLTVFECFLYTDDAIRQFIRRWEKLPGFGNTIFIITGDHRVIPLPATRVKRFHVPLIIYSPLLKNPTYFDSFVAHAQLPATVMGFLSKKYNVAIPQQVAFVSDELDIESKESSLDLALMRSKNETQEYLYHNYLLSENQLFEVGPGLEITPLKDEETLKLLQQKLARYIKASSIALNEDKLLPDSISGSSIKLDLFFTLNQPELDFLNGLGVDSLSPDGLYRRAKTQAFSQNYWEARALLKKALNISPNYEDLRILIARTYAWDGNYDSASHFLDQVMAHSIYEDAYVAYSDLFYWKDNADQSESYARNGLNNFPESFELKARLARIYLIKGMKREAETLINEVLIENPQHEIAVTLKKRLNNG